MIIETIEINTPVRDIVKLTVQKVCTDLIVVRPARSAWVARTAYFTAQQYQEVSKQNVVATGSKIDLYN